MPKLVSFTSNFKNYIYWAVSVLWQMQTSKYFAILRQQEETTKHKKPLKKRWQDPAWWKIFVDVVRWKSHRCRWDENWWDVFLSQCARSFCLLLTLLIVFAIVCLFCWGCTVSERRTTFVSLFFLLLLTTVILFSAFSLRDGWRQSKQMIFLQRFL